MVNSIYRIFKWAVKESGTWEIYLADNFICISFLSIILFLLILNIGLSYSRLTFNKFNLENIGRRLLKIAIFIGIVWRGKYILDIFQAHHYNDEHATFEVLAIILLFIRLSIIFLLGQAYIVICQTAEKYLTKRQR